MIAALLTLAMIGQEHTYDKFKDENTFSLDLGIVYQLGQEFSGHTVRLTLTTIAKQGKDWKPSEPTEPIGLNFNSTSKGWRFLDSREVMLIIDGKRYDLGNPEQKGHIAPSWVQEDFKTDTTLDILGSIGNATKVELRVRDIEMTLTPAQRAKIRDFAVRLRQTEQEAEKTRTELEGKRQAIKEALAKVEQSARNAANRGSKNKKQATYDREYAKGLDKILKDYGFDSKEDLRAFLD